MKRLALVNILSVSGERFPGKSLRDDSSAEAAAVPLSGYY